MTATRADASVSAVGAPRKPVRQLTEGCARRQCPLVDFWSHRLMEDGDRTRTCRAGTSPRGHPAASQSLQLGGEAPAHATGDWALRMPNEPQPVTELRSARRLPPVVGEAGRLQRDRRCRARVALCGHRACLLEIRATTTPLRRDPAPGLPRRGGVAPAWTGRPWDQIDGSCAHPPSAGPATCPHQARCPEERRRAGHRSELVEA
jgi:hypothetical protein